MIFHKSLLDIFNSRTKQKIVLFLLKHEALMSEREISAVLGVSHMSINRTMYELAQRNFVHIIRAGRSHLWRVNRSSFVFQALSESIEHLGSNQAPFEELKKTILSHLPLSQIERITLFGSIARGKEQFNSDIDLYVQVKNSLGKQKVNQAMEKLGLLCLEKFGNVLSPYILSKKELKQKRRETLMAEINQGITLHPQTEIHESQI
jgi:predicted nucleotidyltransferase